MIIQGQTMAVLKKLFEEIMEIFPYEYIHMGSDESSFFQNCDLKSKNTTYSKVQCLYMFYLYYSDSECIQCHI